MNHHYYMAKFAFVFFRTPTPHQRHFLNNYNRGAKETPKENLFIFVTQAAEMERETKTQMDSLPQLPKLLSVQLVPFKSHS